MTTSTLEVGDLFSQTAAASLGVAVGSAAGGLLFDFAPLPGASFLLMALQTVSGILVSLGLPNMLVSLNLGESAFEVEVQKAGSPLGQRSGV